MNLFDSSALLAFLQGESGADVVEENLDSDSPARCSAANWSETAQKVLAGDGHWAAARSLLFDYGLQITPVVEADAELAAGLWQAGSQLSLGDRLCLATAERLDAVVWTADSAWGERARVRYIR